MDQARDLLHACGAGDRSLVEAFLAQGVSIHTVDADGDGVLRYALGTQDLTLFTLLLERGASPNAPSTSIWGDQGFQIVGAVAQAGWAQGVQTLLDRGANVNARGNDGSTPLMGAAASGSLDAVRLLLERGARLDDLDDDGDGPLFYAIDQGRFEVVDHLIANGVNTDPSPNRFGNTPLLLAASHTAPFATGAAASAQERVRFADLVVRLARAGASPRAMYDHGFALARDSASESTQIVPLYDFTRAVKAYDDLRVTWIDRRAGPQLDWVFSAVR